MADFFQSSFCGWQYFAPGGSVRGGVELGHGLPCWMAPFKHLYAPRPRFLVPASMVSLQYQPSALLEHDWPRHDGYFEHNDSVFLMHSASHAVVQQYESFSQTFAVHSLH